jgi:hypothetical protein
LPSGVAPPVAPPPVPGVPPPPPPLAASAVVAKPKAEVRSAADAMKVALTRKASKKIVDRKDDVLALVRKASEFTPASIAESVSTLKAIEEAADELGLPLTGDEWGERLAIKKKGGGVHFDDETRACAATAYVRAGILHSAVTWHEQLMSRGSQISSAVGAFRCGGNGATMSKAKMLERCSELLAAARKTMADIFGDKAFRPALVEMARLGVPQVRFFNSTPTVLPDKS